MRPRWTKVLRDLGAERARSSLVVLAMAMGFVAFGAVLSTWAILDREIDLGYLTTNPASATLRTSPLSESALEGARGLPGVAEIESRRRIDGRVRVGPGEWRNLALFVVADFADQRIAIVEPETGSAAPAAGEMLVERDALGVSGASVGDVLEIRAPDRSRHRLRVAGTVHDPGQAQARMERMVYGYVTRETLALLGEEPYFDEIAVLASGDRFDRLHNHEVAMVVKGWLEARGVTVERVDVPEPGRHPHAEIMGLFLLTQAGFGFLAVLLSGVLVVNLLTAMMAAQRRQIGVIRALGASAWQIAGMYLASALLLGVGAGLVSVPLQVVVAHALCTSLAAFLNFDVTSFSVPGWIYGVEIAVIVALPLAAAAIPVWRASRVPPRQVLTDVGVAVDEFGESPLDRLVVRTGGLGRPALLAMRNGTRRRLRLVLTLATFGIGGAVFLSALNVRASLVGTLDRMFGALEYDLVVSLAEPSSSERVAAIATGIRGIERVEGWLTTQAHLIGEGEEVPAAVHGEGVRPERERDGSHGHLRRVSRPSLGPDPIQVVAIPPDTTLVRLDVVEGRGLGPGDENAMIVTSRLAGAKPEMRVGEEVRLRMGHRIVSWTIVGRTRDTFAAPAAYVSRARLDRVGATGGITNSLRIGLADSGPAAAASVRRALERDLESADVAVAGMSSLLDARLGYREHMIMIYRFLVVMAAIAAVVGGFGLATTMSLNVSERRREIGVLRAIGASPVAIGATIVGEAAFVAILGWLIAALLSWPMTALLSSLLVRIMFKSGLSPVVDPAGLVVWLVGSLVLAAAASAAPARAASRLSVRDAVAYE